MAVAKKKNQVAVIEDEEDFHIDYNPYGGKQVNVPVTHRRKANDPEMIKALCLGLIAGKGILRIIAENKEFFPDVKDIYREIARDPNGLLANSIARAREEAHHAILDKCEALAASITPENIEVVTKQIWWHQWHLARIKPRKYSEKHFIEQTVVDPPKLTSEEFTDIAYRIVDEV